MKVDPATTRRLIGRSEGLVVTCEAHPGEGKHWMRATCVRPWLWEIWGRHARWGGDDRRL